MSQKCAVTPSYRSRDFTADWGQTRTGTEKEAGTTALAALAAPAVAAVGVAEPSAAASASSVDTAAVTGGRGYLHSTGAGRRPHSTAAAVAAAVAADLAFEVVGVAAADAAAWLVATAAPVAGAWSERLLPPLPLPLLPLLPHY